MDIPTLAQSGTDVVITYAVPALINRNIVTTPMVYALEVLTDDDTTYAALTCADDEALTCTITMAAMKTAMGSPTDGDQIKIRVAAT